MKHKWTLFLFSRGDFKTLERYLNEQAEQGWELEKTGILARWKRTERRDLTYCVDLAKPRQDRGARLDYAELCAEGGWELAAFAGQMYIFKSAPDMTPVPIHTDPELERKQYNRYYIRSSILSVVVLAAYLAFFWLMFAALGSSVSEDVREVYTHWMTSWMGVGLNMALPLWAVCALWKLVDFARVLIKGQRGSIGDSPRWVMWCSCVMALLALMGSILFFIGMVLEFLLGADLFVYAAVWLFVWGGALLWKALEIDGELFRGERRRHVALGLASLLICVLLVVGKILLPYGQWSTSRFADWRKGIPAYEQTNDLPLVHGEDVGISFLPEEETVDITSEVIPVGERWEISYWYGTKKTSTGLLRAGNTTFQCFTEKGADRLVDALVNGYELDDYTRWPQEGLTSINIDWADEAWYGTVVPKDGEVISALVLRVGQRVTRLIYPADLLSENNLEIIRTELQK